MCPTEFQLGADARGLLIPPIMVTRAYEIRIAEPLH
jgi:hypothetical protein